MTAMKTSKHSDDKDNPQSDKQQSTDSRHHNAGSKDG